MLDENINARGLQGQTCSDGETEVATVVPVVCPGALLPRLATHPVIPAWETFPDQPAGRYAPLPTTAVNVQHLLQANGVRVVYNTIKKKVSIQIPDLSENSDNADNSRLTLVCGLCNACGMQISQVPAIIELLGDANPYNPVASWIESRPWDGQDRLPRLLATVSTREGFPEELKAICMRKWLLSAVAAAQMEQGFRARGALVFQGPQGIGKTTWLLSLVPDPVLRDAVLKIDHHLDANSKDSVLGAITHWIVEIGELDSSFKKDVARLKGFLTSNTDKVRRPYARTESEYSRRTVFFATVNDANFLVDHTGNTRWWTIPVVTITYAHGIDMQQLFAQLAVQLRDGAQWWLTDEEETQLEQCNREHRTTSVLRDLLLSIIDGERAPGPQDQYKSTSDLFKMLDYKNPKNADAKELTSILRELLGEPKKVQGIMKWRIPVRTKKQPHPPAAKQIADRPTLQKFSVDPDAHEIAF